MTVDPAASSDPTALLSDVRRGYRPPPRLRVSEWCDADLIVPTGPLASTRWRTDFAPYQRGILDAFDKPGIEHVVLMASSQVGKTSVAINLVAYSIVHDPCPILVVEPTVRPMAEDFAKNRFEPLVRATPSLAERMDKRRSPEGSSTTLLKTYRGGLLAIGGANSAASLASRSIRLLVLDEIDRYPPELAGEGNTISIVMKRTAAYRGRRRILMVSSPTMVGAPIDAWFQRGDQRRYHVPCPACGAMNPYRWANVRWHDDDPATARIHCPDCNHGMDDVERIEALASGEWYPDNPDDANAGIASFHVWECYSPFSTLAEMVTGFMRARAAQKAGDKSLMHTWQNTTLGEPAEVDVGEGLEPHALLLRREEYSAAAPDGVACLTMGVDVQDDRLEGLVIGWGPGEEAWIVDRLELPGDTSQPEPWAMLDEVLSHEYLHETGQRLAIAATCIDSAGHRTTLVYEYARRQAARRVYATIGRSGTRPLVSSPSPRKWGREKRQVPLYTVGVDAAKALVTSRLAHTERGPGYVHMPAADWADEELAAQLTAERLVTRWHKGQPKAEWRKVRPRNEMLDCSVLALAALRLLHPDLQLLLERLRNPDAGKPPPPAPKGEWIAKERREGWLRRR